jgi:hypothetical protein
MRPGAGREHEQPPPQVQPQRQQHGTVQSRNERPFYRTCSACQAKNARKMTSYAFSDNAVQRMRFLAFVQACALNTWVHLQSAATSGKSDVQRSIAGLTGLWPEASSGA